MADIDFEQGTSTYDQRHAQLVNALREERDAFFVFVGKDGRFGWYMRDSDPEKIIAWLRAIRSSVSAELADIHRQLSEE